MNVRGTVATTDGWPLPGATVTVVGTAGRQLGRATADQRGGYAVPVDEDGPGTVTVIFAAPGVDPVARVTALRADTDLGTVVLHNPRRTALTPPGTWVIDPAHTIVRATARHLALSRVEGRFTRFAGEIRIADPPERSSVAVTIEAASIDTGNQDRDAHLRSPDFLDAERFPTVSYRSGGLTRLTDERWLVDGTLTIRDITREVTLDTTYGGNGPDPWGGTRLAVRASTELARQDYEMNWNMGLPGGLVVVGPTLRVDLDVQAVLRV